MNQFCDKCGLQINQTTGACPNCAPNQVAVNGGVQTKAKKPMNKKAIILGAIAVVVAFSIVLGIGGILGYVIGKSGNNLPDSYNEIVERYKLVMAGEEDDEKTLSNKLIDKFKESENYEICYSLTDINDDDVDELIVGGCFEDDKNAETYDIYTMDASGKAEQVFDVNSFSENTNITIYNEVIKVTEEDDDYLRFTYNVLPEKECIVKVDEEYYKDDDKYYEVIHNETTADEKNEISEETFEAADNKYDGEELDLEWVKVVLEEDKKDKDTKPQSGAYIDVKNRRSEKADFGYGSIGYNIVEIPQIYGEENEEITRINNEINEEYELFYDEAIEVNSEFDYSGDPFYNFYALPTSTDRYLNLVCEYFPVKSPHNGYCYSVFSKVYDKENSKELTIEGAYEMAGTSEQKIEADVEASMRSSIYGISSGDDIFITSIAFRMLKDGTPQFLVYAYYYYEVMNEEIPYCYTWTNGEAEENWIDYDEIDGEFSCGKLDCQEKAEFNEKVDSFETSRKDGTAEFVAEIGEPGIEYNTGVILASDNTFCLCVNLYEAYGHMLGEYTRSSDGTIKCVVTGGKDFSGFTGEELSGFTLVPISDSKYRIKLDNVDFVGELQNNAILNVR